jgi:hypothetical protein
VPVGEEQSWPAQCRNCETNLRGPYCSACGQSHVHARLELRTLVEHAFDGLVNLDTRALRTIGELTVAPGKVCRDYLDGRRIPYVNPFKYAFATFTCVAIVAEGLIYLNGVSLGPPSDPLTAELDAFRLRWGMLINFIAMPLLAVILWLLFFSAPRRLRWVEHYVLVLFTFGHVALLQALLLPILQQAGSVAMTVFSVLPILLLSWAAVGVYRTRWWTTILRVLAAFLAIQALALGVIRLFVPGLVPD